MPPGSDVCQIMLTNEDATLYQRVVLQVSKVFAEVLADADWVLKGSDGQLLTAFALSGPESWSSKLNVCWFAGVDVTSEEALNQIKDQAQTTHVPHKITWINLCLSRSLEALQQVQVKVSLTQELACSCLFHVGAQLCWTLLELLHVLHMLFACRVQCLISSRVHMQQ